MVRGTLFVLSLLLSSLILLSFAVELVSAWAEPISLHFNLEKHHSYFGFGFLTTVELFVLLILRFLDAVCWQSPKTEFLHLRKHFINWKQ